MRSNHMCFARANLLNIACQHELTERMSWGPRAGTSGSQHLGPESDRTLTSEDFKFSTSDLALNWKDMSPTDRMAAEMLEGQNQEISGFCSPNQDNTLVMKSTNGFCTCWTHSSPVFEKKHTEILEIYLRTLQPHLQRIRTTVQRPTNHASFAYFTNANGTQLITKAQEARLKVLKQQSAQQTTKRCRMLLCSHPTPTLIYITSLES